MKKMEIPVFNDSRHDLPRYATAGSSGMDLTANLEHPLTIRPGERLLIPTGIHIQLPVGYEAQVRPRSGLAIRHGITCLNTPGTVDSDYRGEIKVILINLGDQPFTINDGDRIAQLVVARYASVRWAPVLSQEMLGNSGRDQEGFGHTGVRQF